MPRPNLVKTKVCVSFLSGACINSECTYAHGFAELRQATHEENSGFDAEDCASSILASSMETREVQQLGQQQQQQQPPSSMSKLRPSFTQSLLPPGLHIFQGSEHENLNTDAMQAALHTAQQAASRATQQAALHATEHAAQHDAQQVTQVSVHQSTQQLPLSSPTLQLTAKGKPYPTDTSGTDADLLQEMFSEIRRLIQEEKVINETQTPPFVGVAFMNQYDL